MSAKTTGAGALVAPRPTLWFTESRLGNALANLDAADPEQQMGEEQARQFIAEFVSPEAVVERRDEFAGFLLEGEALVAAKKLQAAVVLEQAARIEKGLAGMRAQAVKVMDAAGVRALCGRTYTLKLKDSPGSVAVDDETLIPEEFWRSRQDGDLAAITRLVQIVVAQATAAAESEGFSGGGLRVELENDELLNEALQMLEAAKVSRRAVDKKLIQAEWKANGETREQVDADTGEVTQAPMVPGAHKQVDTKLIVA